MACLSNHRWTIKRRGIKHFDGKNKKVIDFKIFFLLLILSTFKIHYKKMPFLLIEKYTSALAYSDNYIYLLVPTIAACNGVTKRLSLYLMGGGYYSISERKLKFSFIRVKFNISFVNYSWTVSIFLDCRRNWSEIINVPYLNILIQVLFKKYVNFLNCMGPVSIREIRLVSPSSYVSAD